MRPPGLLIAGFAALIAAVPPAARAAGSDPFFGTWSLEPARSHYAKEPPPLHMTLVIEPAPDGLAYRSDTQYADGRAASSHYTARFGTPALVVGTAGFLAPVSLTRVAEATIEAVYTSGLKKLAWSRWAVNTEGTELVVTTTYIDSAGKENQNVAAFHRVSP